MTDIASTRTFITDVIEEIPFFVDQKLCVVHAKDCREGKPPIISSYLYDCKLVIVATCDSCGIVPINTHL